MFDLMTKRDDFCLFSGKTFLGRLRGVRETGKFICLRLTTIIALKIFHLIYFDSKVKNHLKSHWKIFGDRVIFSFCELRLTKNRFS